jgi:hypothetical protein
MIMADNPTFQIPKDVIEPIIQAHVTAAVSAALLDKEKIIEQAVCQVLNRKVDSDGKASSYSYSTTWLQWAMNDCVANAVYKAISNDLDAHQERIRAYIVRELNKKNSPMLRDLVSGMLGALTSETVVKYRLTVSCDK